jgi:type I restriction enzyme R subunit
MGRFAMNEQLFEDLKASILDLYDKVKSDHQKEKVSILEDVDFELELIHRDEINVNLHYSVINKTKIYKHKKILQNRKRNI